MDNFINGINKDFKWDFEAFYQDSRYDIDGFSFLYFYKYIIKRSNNVIDEIKENLLFISTEKELFYLNYVDERVKRDVVANVDSSFLNKWIKKYDVSNLQFPFTKNSDLKIILSTAIDEYKEFVSPEDQLTIHVQKDFHLYTYYLEKNKIIDFINSLLVERGYEAIEETSGIENKKIIVPGEEIIGNDEANVEPEKSENPHPQVFLNIEAYELFQKLFEAFKTSQSKLADFSFIYRKMYKDELILDSFKPQMFINWINRYPFNISLDKLKTLDNCSTLNKVQTYNIIKEALQSK